MHKLILFKKRAFQLRRIKVRTGRALKQFDMLDWAFSAFETVQRHLFYHIYLSTKFRTAFKITVYKIYELPATVKNTNVS